MAELSALTRSNIAPRAPEVLRSARIASANSWRASATRAATSGFEPSSVDALGARQAIDESAERRLGLPEPLPREVQLFPIVPRQQEIAHRRGPVSLRDDVGNRVRVAERLRHLLVVDEQMLDVHPEAGERLAGRPFALRDLVLVVGKDQIDAAGMDVDRRLAEQAQRHRRAFQMPPRAARRIDEVPRRLARLGRLPEHEVADVFLLVAVAVDARARLHAVVVEPREAAVGRQRRDPEIDGSIAAIRQPVSIQRGDHVGHRFADWPRRSRAASPPPASNPSAARILVKRRDELVGVRPERHARFLGARNRPVVHVGEVDHLTHLIAEQMPKRSSQHVHADERTEIADVPACVHRQPAGVDPHRACGAGREGLLGSRHGVVKTHQVLIRQETA